MNPSSPRQPMQSKNNYRPSLPRPVSIVLCAAVVSACSGQRLESVGFVPGLGEIMAQTASRHTKLWFAGLGRNWELAAYEIDELKEGFEDAGKFHPTHKDIKQALPDLLANYMNSPLDGLEHAIKARDLNLFEQSFDNLTAACNACHQATEFGFNKVQRSSFNPFPNQKFDEKN
jgi:hypothetical protein